VRKEGEGIGEWHRINSPQYRSHEPIREVPGVGRYTAWGCAWRIAVATLVVYALITAALVLTTHA
jgi:hypothetical protein